MQGAVDVNDQSQTGVLRGTPNKGTPVSDLQAASEQKRGKNGHKPLETIEMAGNNYLEAASPLRCSRPDELDFRPIIVIFI